MVEQTLIAAGLAALTGVITFLWHNIEKERNAREQADEKQQEQINQNEKKVSIVWRQLFGADHDATDEGHFEEVENRFDRIERKIDQVEKHRKEEHQEVLDCLRDLNEEDK